MGMVYYKTGELNDRNIENEPQPDEPWVIVSNVGNCSLAAFEVPQIVYPKC